MRRNNFLGEVMTSQERRQLLAWWREIKLFGPRTAEERAWVARVRELAQERETAAQWQESA